MAIQLDETEARVLGCLLEKSIITPDQYPMTLNALVNACNQKSSREPVMNLEPGAVSRALNSLSDKHVVRREENFKSQVEKFTHRFCNTPFSDYQFDAAQYSVICVLLLRGSRTPGELRSNSGRLHTFADNAEVQETLNSLMDGENGSLVVRLPRSPGRRDHEYMHVFCGEPESAPAEQFTAPAPVAPAVSAPPATGLESRLDDLERRVLALEALLEDKD